MQPTNLKAIARDATLRDDTKTLFDTLDLLERVVPLATFMDFCTELEELRLQGARPRPHWFDSGNGGRYIGGCYAYRSAFHRALCLPSHADRPPSGTNWIHEIKHDGYRLMARRASVGIRLITRRGNDCLDRFPLVVEAVNHLPWREWPSLNAKSIWWLGMAFPRVQIPLR
jgi:hypothetical protein